MGGLATIHCCWGCSGTDCWQGLLDCHRGVTLLECSFSLCFNGAAKCFFHFFEYLFDSNVVLEVIPRVRRLLGQSLWCALWSSFLPSRLLMHTLQCLSTSNATSPVSVSWSPAFAILFFLFLYPALPFNLAVRLAKVFRRWLWGPMMETDCDVETDCECGAAPLSRMDLSLSCYSVVLQVQIEKPT